MFCKIGVPRNFAKFTGKHLCQRLMSPWRRGFPVYFVKFLKGPLHLAKFAIANIGQVLVQVLVQVLTQYLVQVFHFSGFSFCEKLFFHSSYAVLTCTRNGRNSFTSDFNNC